MNRARKPRRDTWRKVCEAKGANITEIAKSLGLSRRTIHSYIEKDKAMKEIYDDVRESLIDLCETQLTNLIKGVPKYEKQDDGTHKFIGWTERPSEAAIIFTLKTRGKDRGYVERTELTGKDGASLVSGMSKEEILSEIKRIDEILAARNQ